MHETVQIGEKHEKDLSRVIPCPTTVTNRDLDNCSEEIDGACLKFTRTERDVEAGSELWLDARQFLAGEEDESAIFDKWGRSCSPNPPMAHPDNTKASDYSRRENISVDCHTEDWELRFPPVERRSSSDSWASALSDWFQAVNTYSEDSFTSANTSSTGFKLSMAIQDDFLEQRTSPDNANNTGLTCLSLNLLESEEPGQALSRGLVESDNTNGTLFKQGDRDGLPSHSDSDRQDNTTMENNMSLLEMSESHKTDKNAVLDMLNASKCPANKVSAKHYGSQHTPGEFWSAKSEGNVLVEVTGDKDSQLGLVFEEERESSFTSQRISAYISDKNLTDSAKDEFKSEGGGCEDRPVTVVETIVITEKIVPKTQGKKKKKYAQHGTPKPENDQLTDLGSRNTQKSVTGKTENLDVKVTSNGLDKPAAHPPNLEITNKQSIQKVMSVRPKVHPIGSFAAKMDPDGVNATQKATPIKLRVDAINTAMMENKTCTSDSLSTCLSSMLNDDIKRRRITDNLSGAVPIRTRPQLPAIFRQARKDGEDTTRRAYKIQADPVPDDPQNILLWCQFRPVPPDATIKWTKEGTVLSEINKVEKDDSRFTLTILKACSKDLGLYKCSLNAANISVSTSEYHLTSEVLMELVIPSHDQPAEPRVVDGDEENIQCSPLLFKEDFLSDQYFGENQPASIVTEKVHFGEGMHRKAFRTTLREGNLPSFNPGHPCVLKVHNAIGYGTKNNEELVQKNYSLAVEECHVQNTAREYIKAYNSVAKSAESFGELPEIIPIYLVHRPSNNIPYATLEEELLGDFVKYSVKDGKEINLMRRDSEAGQKCCAFQHWVYTQTEGNLLVTDMQGVGMKLTDVGIATCKKGYCELLGLTSLQPKPKPKPKPKTQPAPKKKTFGPVLNGKS
ncbi:hypothetical protein cypCar_00001772 [Cyprinus carpio]|nr:hypothetical protein cypCar_00001772 [Cyprinus carpio]